SDQILCESRLTKREYVALPSTTITCHPRGANVWPRTLTENAEPVRFNQAAKGAKAFIVIGPVKMAFLTADRPSNHQPISAACSGQPCPKADFLHSRTLNVQLNDLWLHHRLRHERHHGSAARGCLSGGVSRYFLPASSSRSLGVKAALSRA